MNCNIVKDLLPLYEDRETRPETTAEIKEHLAECEECREYYKNICHIARSLKAPPAGTGKYRYTVIANRIRRRNTLALSAACLSFLAVGCLAGNVLFSGKE